MGFLFGLMIGGMAASGGGSSLPALGSIPLRCLYAFEQSEQEYTECRRPSLRAELYGRSSYCRNENDTQPGCLWERNIVWEIRALREMKKAAEANASRVGR